MPLHAEMTTAEGARQRRVKALEDGHTVTFTPASPPAPGNPCACAVKIQYHQDGTATCTGCGEPWPPL